MANEHHRTAMAMPVTLSEPGIIRVEAGVPEQNHWQDRFEFRLQPASLRHWR